MFNNTSNFGNALEELEYKLIKNDFDKCFGDTVPKFHSPRERIPKGDLRDQLGKYCWMKSVVFIDTCSLLHDGGLRLLEEVEAIFPRYGKKLYIFSSVLYEVKNVGSKNPDKRKACDQILQKLKELESKGIVKVLTSANKSFSDVNFISQFIQMASLTGEHHLLLITQDDKLAKTINNLCDYYGDVVKTRSHCEALQIGESFKLERF